jgi:hypothetical protein
MTSQFRKEPQHDQPYRYRAEDEMSDNNDMASAVGTGLPMNEAASPSSPPVGIPDAARDRINSVIDWCRYQADNAMSISAGAATTHGDDSGALQMLNSIASDIDINLSMLAAYLTDSEIQP